MDPSSVTTEQASKSEVSPSSEIPILNLKGDFFKDIPYKRGRCLGSGMSGFVVEAVNEDDPSKRWAVKMMPLRGGTISEATVRRLFSREVNVLRLEHKGFVKCFLAAKCPDHLCIAMKLYPCGDLVNCLPSIPACAKAWIAGRIADAVAFLHGKRIIHGDIKPDNILIDNGFAPVLGDFGLARHFSQDLVSSGPFGGTPGFWAPEIQPPRSPGDLVDPFKVRVFLYMYIYKC